MNYMDIVEKFFNASRDAKAMGYELTFEIAPNDIIDKEGNLYTDSNWFGGLLFTLENKEKGITIDLRACGEVRATLLHKEDNTVIEDVTDKNNCGYFRDAMDYWLKGDDDLYRCEQMEDPEKYLVFENNNWFEGFVQTPTDDFFDVVDGSIIEIIEDVNGLIEWAEQ